VTISTISTTLGMAAKFVLAPLFGLMLYIWNRHVKSNEKEFQTVNEKLDEHQKLMAELGIKTTDDYMKVKTEIEEYKEKNGQEIKEKMDGSESRIMKAIGDNGAHISRLFDLFNDHKLKTEKRLTKIETIITK